jgi:hypothetical protein
MLVEVSVRVDAVDAGDLAVAVVVAQVLPPQAFVVERVLVAVRIRDDDEPQLGVLEQPLDRLVVRAPSVDEVVQQPPIDLGADPLAGVLGRAVENRRAAAVGDVAGRLSDLQREQFAPTVGVALRLDQLRLSLATACSSSRMPLGSSTIGRWCQPLSPSAAARCGLACPE